MKTRLRGIAAAALIVIALPAAAQRTQVEVESAWARPTVAGQTGTGAFMRLKSKDGARLLGASAAVAGVVEIHEMAMDGNVMKMRPLPSLELPAGSMVELKPGGSHMMLMDLKRPLSAGEKIKVELQLKTGDGKLVTQPIDIEVRPRAP